MELSEKVSQIAIIIMSHLVLEMHLFGFDATLESLMLAVKSSIR